MSREGSVLVKSVKVGSNCYDHSPYLTITLEYGSKAAVEVLGSPNLEVSVPRATTAAWLPEPGPNSVGSTPATVRLSTRRPRRPWKQVMCYLFQLMNATLSALIRFLHKSQIGIFAAVSTFLRLTFLVTMSPRTPRCAPMHRLEFGHFLHASRVVPISISIWTISTQLS